MIEALVLSGCFYNIFKMYGCVYELSNHLNNIKDIYATSGGSLIAILVALNIDKEVALTYIHERPWIKLLQIKNLSFYRKGIFDKTIFNEMIKPILLSVDLREDVTLQQLYKKTNINLTFTTTKFSDLSLEYLSHTTHPDLLLSDAIAMTCCIPILFEAVFYKNDYYIDGGVCCHFPIKIALEKYKKENVLGISTKTNFSKELLNEESTSMEFLLELNKKLLRYVVDDKNKDQVGEIDIVIEGEPINKDTFYDLVTHKDIRMSYITIGRELSKKYLSKLAQNHENLLCFQ